MQSDLIFIFMEQNDKERILAFGCRALCACRGDTKLFIFGMTPLRRLGICKESHFC